MTAPVLPNQQHHRPGASGPGAYGGVRRRSLVRRAGRNGRTSPCAALCGGREGERRSSAKLAGCGAFVVHNQERRDAIAFREAARCRPCRRRRQACGRQSSNCSASLRR